MNTTMQIRFQQSPQETARMNTAQLRENFLVENLMQVDQVTLVYSHYDRVIIGGVKPVNKEVILETHTELKAAYFLERREIGILNVGGKGSIAVDGTEYTLDKLSCLYIGKGAKEVSFRTAKTDDPAIFYLVSTSAHQEYNTRLMHKEEAAPVETGDQLTANKRTIYKYIHADGIQSAQLVMGLTVLAPGSVWNTMPAHTHTRRMEAYYYFDLDEEQRVIHLMGEPTETRHLLVANHQAIISPPWGIHSGCGTANYGFIWAMGGENYTYTDMDPAPASMLR